MSADTIHRTFEAYYDVFARDPAAAAANYAEPTMMVSSDRVSVLDKREVEAQLARILGRLKSEGYVRTELGEPRVRFLADKTAIFRTLAVRLRADGSEVERAAYDYLVVDGASGWKIQAAIAVDIDKFAAGD